MRFRLSYIFSILLLLAFSLSLAASVETAFASSICDAAQFVADVTIPDGTYIDPGATFTKTWRIKNVGACSWNPSYSVVFSSGDQMGGPDQVFFPRFVSPGQAVDLSVRLTAPTTAGTFRGYWKLKNDSGTIFGIGPAQANAFWVEIRVLTPLEMVVAYDFVAEMCSAAWGYDGGPIPCPVNSSKKDLGYVERLDNPILENGLAAGAPGLLTVPQNKYNGAIHGVFPVEDIFRGDHFQAIIGCQYGAVNCYVTYQLDYLLEGGGGMVTLWRFRERYDGLYYQVDFDLTPMANRKAFLVLSVYASGPSVGDQPLWIAPRIVRSASAPVVTPTPIPPTSTNPTITPISTVPTPTPIPPTSTNPTITPVPTSLAGCDRAQFISDVTVPDGTIFAPNASFTKTWRLKNVGTCTWTTAYSVVFASGDRMGGVDTLIPQTVVPGQTVDVGVNLTAPSLTGSYRGYWQLKNDSGGLFGIGPSYDQSFYVDIKVSGTGTGGSTVLDFVNSVCSAQWFSGAGVLPCPGTDGDARGFVLNLTNPRLENGTTDSRPGLLTFPQNTFNGYIQGIYPTFAVQAGDRFQATLNCEYGAVDCFVIFRLDAEMASGVTQSLGTFGERYDGLYYPANIDLSSLAGKNVNFILTVFANGAATGDRAVWVGPRIVRGLVIGSGSPAIPTSTEVPIIATETPIPADTFTPVPPIPSDTSTPVPPTPSDTFTPVPPIPSDTPQPTATQ